MTGVAKTARRLAVALTISIGIGLLMVYPWKSSLSSLFLRTITLGLSATAVFSLFEAWPRTLPRWFQRWVLQVVAVGVAMPITTFVMHRLSAPQGAPPSWDYHDWLILGFAAVLVAPSGRRKRSPAI
jgi:drug/metabolite transporter (DMT)-like permease